MIWHLGGLHSTAELVAVNKVKQFLGFGDDGCELCFFLPQNHVQPLASVVDTTLV